MSDEDDAIEEISESNLFDVSSIKHSVWLSKDRKKCVITLEDIDPLNQMKIYLWLSAKNVQLGTDLGIYEQAESEDSPGEH